MAVRTLVVLHFVSECNDRVMNYSTCKHLLFMCVRGVGALCVCVCVSWLHCVARFPIPVGRGESIENEVAINTRWHHCRRFTGVFLKFISLLVGVARCLFCVTLWTHMCVAVGTRCTLSLSTFYQCLFSRQHCCQHFWPWECISVFVFGWASFRQVHKAQWEVTNVSMLETKFVTHFFYFKCLMYHTMNNTLSLQRGVELQCKIYGVYTIRNLTTIEFRNIVILFTIF